MESQDISNEIQNKKNILYVFTMLQYFYVIKKLLDRLQPRIKDIKINSTGF